MPSSLKIASWNINSIRARTEIVEKFLTEEAPDILCLQETKVRDTEFPEGLFRRLGYNHLFICGQPMHHGVAIVSKVLRKASPPAAIARIVISLHPPPAGSKPTPVSTRPIYVSA